MAAVQQSIYQLRIALQWLEPPIWRRVLVPADVTLAKLHRIIQAVMGWENAHLHQFMVGKVIYGEPEPGGGFGGSPIKEERKARLNKVAPKVRNKFLYEYDFGDGWVHEVVVEKVVEAYPEQRYPVCVAGERACPPEDCGGPPGYQGMLEALADLDHPERGEFLEWLGGDDFDPEAFDLDRANAALRRVR